VNTYQKFRRTIFRVLDADSRATGFERAGNFAVVALILANVAAVILESVPWVYTRYGAEFLRFEVFSVTVFTIEYLLRLWTCVEKDNYRRPIVGRLQFAVSPIALLDFAAILPSYLPGEVFLDLRFARIIRALRMVRILKFARYSRTLQTFGAVFHQKRTDIGLMTLFLVLIVVIASSLMYFVEHTAQPQQFASIPAAMWWSVTTLTTVGYGDMYPITPLGKLIGAVIAVIGIGFFALPAGILAAAFADELTKQRAKQRLCPHCGKEIGDVDPE
jgi:voltage-gated potassium channel